MSVLSYQSYIHTSWGSYRDMSYLYSSWSSWMSSPLICFYSDLIPYRGSLASRSSLVHNVCFYSKERSMDKVKCQVIKQVWCVKNDWNVEKNQIWNYTIKKADSHKSASIVDQTCPKQDVIGQKPHSTSHKVLKRRRLRASCPLMSYLLNTRYEPNKSKAAN
jgi:hypothetical protein